MHRLQACRRHESELMTVMTCLPSSLCFPANLSVSLVSPPQKYGRIHDLLFCEAHHWGHWHLDVQSERISRARCIWFSFHKPADIYIYYFLTTLKPRKAAALLHNYFCIQRNFARHAESNSPRHSMYSQLLCSLTHGHAESMLFAKCQRDKQCCLAAHHWAKRRKIQLQ